jgi:hypothetical protein
MGFFGRLRTGWALSMDSLRVLRGNPKLALFPVIAGIAGLVYVGLLLGGAFVATDGELGPVAYGALFVTYVGSTFIASFFTAALMYNAREAFHGRNPGLGEGLAAAWRNKWPLLAWAIVAGTVGVVLRAIESSDNLAARIAAVIFSVAWSILTYFVVPVIVFEDVGVVGMFKRSGETFKNTWGETAGAGFGVGIVSVLFALVGLAVAVLVFFLVGDTVGVVGAIAVGAAALLLAYLLGTTLTGIAKTALYVYATEGQRPREFENVDFGRANR